MSDKEKAEIYLMAYCNYEETNKMLQRAINIRDESYKTLCVAAQAVLGLSDTEMNRVLFIFDNLAAEAKKTLGKE